MSKYVFTNFVRILYEVVDADQIGQREKQTYILFPRLKSTET